MNLLFPIELSIVAASVVSVIFLLFAIPNNYAWMIVTGLLLILLVIINRIYLNDKPTATHTSVLNTVVTTLIYLFIMLVLLVTGNVFSPFLILIHLTILGTGLFIKQSAGVWALLCIVSVLLVQIGLQPDIRALISDDPWAPAIYLISFLAIFPLLNILVHKYQFRSKVIDFLNSKVMVVETREKAILQSVKELIFVTNLELQILSVNDAARKTLGISPSQLILTPIETIFDLYDQHGAKYDLTTNITQSGVLTRSSTIVSPLQLRSAKLPKALEVTLEIKPIIGITGEVEQISLIITRHTTSRSSSKENISIDVVRSKLEQRRYSLLNNPTDSHHKSHEENFVGIINTEWDLINTLQISQEVARPRLEVVDIGMLWQKVTKVHTILLQDLDVHLTTDFPQLPIKTEYLDTVDTHITVPAFEKSVDLRVLSNEQWLRLLLEKLFEIQIYLAAATNTKTVTVHLHAGTDAVTVEMHTDNASVSKNELLAFFSSDPIALPFVAQIHYASGLEGLLAQQIIRYLDLPFILEVDANTIRFCITLSKTSRIHE